jgi:hypothetical protein
MEGLSLTDVIHDASARNPSPVVASYLVNTQICKPGARR